MPLVEPVDVRAAPYRSLLTAEERAWDDDVIAEGLHLKHDEQLVEMRDAHARKRRWLRR